MYEWDLRWFDLINNLGGDTTTFLLGQENIKFLIVFVINKCVIKNNLVLIYFRFLLKSKNNNKKKHNT